MKYRGRIQVLAGLALLSLMSAAHSAPNSDLRIEVPTPQQFAEARTQARDQVLVYVLVDRKGRQPSLALAAGYDLNHGYLSSRILDRSGESISESAIARRLQHPDPESQDRLLFIRTAGAWLVRPDFDGSFGVSQLTGSDYQCLNPKNPDYNPCDSQLFRSGLLGSKLSGVHLDIQQLKALVSSLDMLAVVDSVYREAEGVHEKLDVAEQRTRNDEAVADYTRCLAHIDQVLTHPPVSHEVTVSQSRNSVDANGRIVTQTVTESGVSGYSSEQEAADASIYADPDRAKQNCELHKKLNLPGPAKLEN